MKERQTYDDGEWQRQEEELAKNVWKDKALAAGRIVFSGITILCLVVALLLPWLHVSGQLPVKVKKSNETVNVSCDAHMEAFYIWMHCSNSTSLVEVPNHFQIWATQDFNMFAQRLMFISCWLALVGVLLAMAAVALFRWSRFHWFSILCTASSFLLTLAVSIVFLGIGYAISSDSNGTIDSWPSMYRSDGSIAKMGPFLLAGFTPAIGYYFTAASVFFSLGALVCSAIPRLSKPNDEQEWKELLAGGV